MHRKWGQKCHSSLQPQQPRKIRIVNAVFCVDTGISPISRVKQVLSPCSVFFALLAIGGWGRGCIRREGTSEAAPEAVFGRRLEGVAQAVGGGYCRLQMPLKLALGVRKTVAARRQGALEGGGGYLPSSNASLAGGLHQARCGPLCSSHACLHTPRGGGGLQCPRWARAAPAPHDIHRPLSSLHASSALRSTDVFWPLPPPAMAWVAVIRTLSGQAYIPVRGHSFTGSCSAGPTRPSHVRRGGWSLG